MGQLIEASGLRTGDRVRIGNLGQIVTKIKRRETGSKTRRFYVEHSKIYLVKKRSNFQSVKVRQRV